MSERKERVSIDTCKAIELLADTSDICDEQVSNQSAHATPWAGCDGPSVEETGRSWCFASPGPFGPRGEAGLLKICGNGSTDEGHQGMGANLIYHSIRGIQIETSFSLDGSDPILVTFPEPGEVKIVPLESWDGYTRIYIPLDAIDGDDIEAALGKIVAAPLPYAFQGEVYGCGGLTPLTYGCGGLNAVYQTARCPGFLRRQRIRGHGMDIQGDILIPEDAMWMPGRLKLSRSGDEFVGNLLESFVSEHPFAPLEFFATQLAEAQEKYPSLVLSPPEEPTVEEIKAITGLFSKILGWNYREVPDLFRGGYYDFAWEDFSLWFEGWEGWIEGEVRAAGMRYFRDPEDPQAAPLSGGLVSIPEVIEELRSEERVPVVGIQKDWFSRSGWGVLCLFGGMGDPTHDYTSWGELSRMHREHSEFAVEEGAEGVSLDHSGAECVSNKGAKGGSIVHKRPQKPRAASATDISALAKMISEAAKASREGVGGAEATEPTRESPDVEEASEPAAEEADTRSRAREVCRGRARVAPGGPKIEMAVIRTAYRETGRAVPTVQRPDREPMDVSAHDMRLFAVWSYLTGELQQAAGIQKDLYVAIDNTDPMTTRAGKTVETQAYCVGSAVVLCSRASTWLGSDSRGKKPHMQDVDSISALIRTCSHEIAHVLTKGDAHSPAWINAEKQIWRAVSKKGLFKQVKAILKPADSEIALNLPRAD